MNHKANSLLKSEIVHYILTKDYDKFEERLKLLNGTHSNPFCLIQIACNQHGQKDNDCFIYCDCTGDKCRNGLNVMLLDIDGNEITEEDIEIFFTYPENIISKECKKAYFDFWKKRLLYCYYCGGGSCENCLHTVEQVKRFL